MKGDHKLYYAISVNETKPVFVNIHAESESKEWKQNVLRGYAEGKTVHEINRTRESVIRIYFPETGLVINTIEID